MCRQSASPASNLYNDSYDPVHNAKQRSDSQHTGAKGT